MRVLNANLNIQSMSYPRQSHQPFSFCYTNPSRSHQDLDEVRSVASYKTYLSHNSGTSTSNHLQRVNELKPKPKLDIPSMKASQIVSPKRVSGLSEGERYERPSLKTQMLEQSQNLNYQQIKPTTFFSWGRIGFLCGSNDRKMVENGCTCSQPCPWKIEWTKNQHKNDRFAYLKLLNIKPSQASASQIDKDISRTHGDCYTFSRNGKFRQMLREMLVCYSVYDGKIGYVQGMNMIAGVLLYHIKTAEQTFWAFVELMEQKELRSVYLEGLDMLKVHSREIMKQISMKINDLYQHMNALGIDSSCFINGWLLTLMSNAIPLEQMHTVISRFKEEGWSYIYRLILAFLCYSKEGLMYSEDEAEFLMYMSSQNYKDLEKEWQEIIKSADNLKF